MHFAPVHRQPVREALLSEHGRRSTVVLTG